jgi:L-threonylcarbamoyladenylate synthase
METLRFVDGADVAEAAAGAGRVVGSGGVVLLPTETFYGLAADPRDARAVARIFRIKDRPQGLPLPVLCSDWQQLESLCRVPEAFRVRLSRSWPGPLTAVLPVRQPLAAAGDRSSVAVRIPGHDLLRALLYKVGPLTGTSANRSGQTPHTVADAALASLAGPVDLALDGGPTAGGLASTLVDLTSDRVRVLRSGAISWGDEDFWRAAGVEG